MLSDTPRGRGGGGGGLEGTDAARIAGTASDEQRYKQRLERRGEQEPVHHFAVGRRKKRTSVSDEK